MPLGAVEGDDRFRMERSEDTGAAGQGDGPRIGGHVQDDMAGDVLVLTRHDGEVALDHLFPGG